MLILGLLAVVTLVSAVAAMVLRNLVHCALALAVTFAGLAAVYLALGAQFVGFAQVLVYIGAVSILIVFAILLTRSNEPAAQPLFSGTWLLGVVVTVGVFGVLAGAVLASHSLPRETPAMPEATVRQIGERLMTQYILPLEAVGLLLTAALIGAVILAMPERRGE